MEKVIKAEKVEKIKLSKLLNQTTFISELISPTRNNFPNLYKSKAVQVKEAFLNDVISEITDDTTDQGIVDLANNIVNKMFFENKNNKCFTSQAAVMIPTNCRKNDDFTNILSHYKILFNVRTVKGLYNQIGLFARKSAIKAITFMNAFYEVAVEYSVEIDNQRYKFDWYAAYLPLVEIYYDVCFDTQHEFDDDGILNYFSDNIFLNKALNYIENTEIGFTLPKVG